MTTLRSHIPATPSPTAIDATRDAFADRAAWRTQLSKRRLEPLPRGADAAFDTLVGQIACRLPRTGTLLRRADAVLKLDATCAAMNDTALREAGDVLRAVFRRGRETRADVTRACAVIREAAWRCVRMKPYRVQVAAGLALADGRLVEMATGEGKTLAATLPAILAGFRGHGCHVITVNDYLAQRDAEQMAPLYRFFGLRVAFITQASPPEERRHAYAADVTYCTNKEVAADFLRDHVAAGGRGDLNHTLTQRLIGQHRPGAALPGLPGAGVMRGLACAIIDEADSILIDEAVTPLILSSQGTPGSAPGSGGQPDPRYAQALQLTESLEEGRDYVIEARHRELRLTRAGERGLAQRAESLDGLWRSGRIRHELAQQALTARRLFLRDRHYVVQDGKVVIVDESTGRLMPDRTWRHGLHQMIEVKEGLDASPNQVTLAQISFQKFFRLYRRLSGMTGTAWETRFELRQVYRLTTVRVPTNKPCIRTHEPPEVCADVQDKLKRLVADVQSIHATGRPILIGTRNVESSRAISERLTSEGLPHVVLDAVNHAHEAKVVADAGFRGAITVATNMAGRGTDIKLGPGVAPLGGLCVLAWEPNESLRVDRQLFGRAGRQGDPGSARLYLCPDDELFKRFPRPRKWMARCVGWRVMRRVAQASAERLGLLRRRAVLHGDRWIDEHLGFTAPDH